MQCCCYVLRVTSLLQKSSGAEQSLSRFCHFPMFLRASVCLYVYEGLISEGMTWLERSARLPWWPGWPGWPGGPVARWRGPVAQWRPGWPGWPGGLVARWPGWPVRWPGWPVRWPGCPLTRWPGWPSWPVAPWAGGLQIRVACSKENHSRSCKRI